MLMLTGDLKPGMVTEKGTVQEVVLNLRKGIHKVVYSNDYTSHPLDFVHVRVTAVPGKHVKQGMHLEGYGEVEDVADYRGTVRIRSYPDRYFILSPEKSYPLSTKTDPVKGVDAHKHLLWAIDNNDWAQARAALTELEKRA